MLKRERRRTAKEYKKTVKKCKRNFDSNFANEIRNLKSNDPRQFWSLINKSSDSKNNMNEKQPSCEEFLNMFKMFGNDQAHADNNPDDNSENDQNPDENNHALNIPISTNEVLKAIKDLKSHKAHGLDYIINEFLQKSCSTMSIVFTKLFNVVLNTGIVPNDWTVGVIHPIYKNKGCKNDPLNYRGITLLSCFGKLFTSILNDRITKYLEQNNLLGQEQAGFRKNFSTVDHLFTLYGIIDILLSKKKRLYCAFLDFEKAFDKVDRAFLWQKLLSQNINGKVLTVIKNLYANAKSCIRANNNVSDFFQVNVGVRQGENLSPVLFALFLNDMNDFMSNTMSGLQTVANEANICDMDEGHVNVFLKLFLLLYADDTAVFAETAKKLQEGLNQTKIYCDLWKLKLNASKCKVVIFSRGKVRVYPEFKIGDEILEVVSDFLYLGIRLNYNNKMGVTQKDLFDRASRAMFSLLKKCKMKNLPIDVILDLFDKMIMPIVTYGCEMWGFGNNDIVKKLQLKFYKIVLKLRKSTPSQMVFGEIGKYPIDVYIKNRIMNFWFRLVSDDSNKLSTIVYKCLYAMYKKGSHESLYIKNIRNILIDIGLPYLWDTQDVSHLSKTKFSKYVNQYTKDIFIQQWYTDLNGSMYDTYRLFKSNFKLEDYINVLPYNCVISLIRFRTTNNRLPVNVLRFHNVDRENRVCALCNTDDVADEYHYIFKCSHFDDKRNECLDRKYSEQPSHNNFSLLFNTNIKLELLKLKHFIDCINNALK